MVNVQIKKLKLPDAKCLEGIWKINKNLIDQMVEQPKTTRMLNLINGLNSDDN